MGGYSRNLIPVTCGKYARKPNLLETGQEYRAFYMKVYECFIVSGYRNYHKISLLKLNGFRLLG
jgi:hypothetical protein